MLAKEFMRAELIGDDVQGTRSSDLLLPTSLNIAIRFVQSSFIFEY